MSLCIIFLIICGCFFFKMDKIKDYINNSDIINTDVEPDNNSLSLVMVGDALIHSGVYDNMNIDIGSVDYHMVLSYLPYLQQLFAL